MDRVVQENITQYHSFVLSFVYFSFFFSFLLSLFLDLSNYSFIYLSMIYLFIGSVINICLFFIF